MILQFLTQKSWVIEQLYTKSYSVFLRPEDIPENNNQTSIDTEAPFLFINMPDIAWRCLKMVHGQLPDESVPRSWIRYLPQNKYSNITLEVDGLLVIDKTGDSILGTYNIGVLGNEILIG